MTTLPLLAHGITHLTDARYFAAWHPDYLCFPVGPGGIAPEYFTAIREWVEGPVCVAELSTEAGAEALQTVWDIPNLTHVMLDYGTDSSPLTQQSLQPITRLPVAGYHAVLDVADRLAEVPDPVVLDFTDGGITWSDLVDGHPFSVGLLKELIGERKVYVRIDLTPDEVVEARDTVYGLALRGSSEEKVGYKSFDDIDDILEALE